MDTFVVVGAVTSIIIALCNLWQATRAAKHTQPNGHGTVPDMLSTLVNWSITVDGRLDHLAERLNHHIDDED